MRARRAEPIFSDPACPGNHAGPRSFVAAGDFGHNTEGPVCGSALVFITLECRKINTRTIMLDELFPRGAAHYLQGGLLIGAGVSLLFALTGLLGGTSTFFSSTWSYVSKQPFFRQYRTMHGGRAWRLLYAAGLILGAVIYLLAFGEPFQTRVGTWQLLAGGFLIGFGSRMARGCTAGHGICGLASLRLPSLVAVLTFLGTGIAVAHLVAALGGR